MIHGRNLRLKRCGKQMLGKEIYEDEDKKSPIF